MNFKLFSEIIGLEKVAKRYDTYKSKHPGTRKSPSDKLFQHKKNLLGHTESGKPVHINPDHSSHHGFSKKDHQDAARLHEHEFRGIHKKIKKTNTPNLEDAKRYWEHSQGARKHRLWSELKD